MSSDRHPDRAGRLMNGWIAGPFFVIAALMPPASPAFASIRPVVSPAGQLPVLFEENRGQAPDEVRFLARTADFLLLLTGREAILVPWNRAASTPQEGSPAPSVVRMTFPGSDGETHIAGEQAESARTSYLRGSDPAGWHGNVPNYRRVRYTSLYPGIDLLFYGGGGRIEYDFVVQTGADPDQITVDFQGVSSLRLNPKGELALETPAGELRHLAPRVSQETAGKRVEVSGKFVLRDAQTVGFELGPYDQSLPLTIDPVIVFSTYWGGSEGDVPGGVAVDSEGFIYLTGSTGSLDFPLLNPVQGEFAGGGTPNGDTFVTKFDPTGSRVIYSTYVGGFGTDIARGLAVDSQGRAVVAGTTFSQDFPSTPGAFQTICSGLCPFVYRLTPDGTAFSFSTFIGRGDGTGVAVDSQDQIIVVGATSSSDYPVVNAAQSQRRGGRDAVVTKLNSAGSALIFSTYLGGSGDENLIGKQDVATDPAGNIFVVGRTNSNDFPLLNAVQLQRLGGTEAYVTKYTPAGGLIFSTYLGGTDDDEARGVVADAAGDAYFVGHTRSTDFPTVDALQPTFGGGVGFGDAFVARIASAGSNLVFSTYLGGVGADTANDVALDSLGRIVVAGTGTANFPVHRSLRAFEGIDNVVVKLAADGSELIYSTPIGGGDQDVVVTVLETDVLVAGNISSGNYPVLNALQPRTMGGTEIFLTHLADGGTLYFAQFANGDGAVSDLLLTGSSAVTTATATVTFRGSDGATLSPNVTVVGGQAQPGPGGEGLVVEVPPLGLVRISTDGTGPLTAGSVTVDFDSPLGGTIRFTLTPFGTAGVGESRLVRGFISPVRRTAINTGVAIFNPQDRQIGLTMRLRNLAGEEIPGGLRSTALGPHEHLAQFINEIFPNANLENFEGTLTVETSSLNALIAATALELGSQPGQFTTLPVTPVP